MTFIIFWDYLMFKQLLFSPEVERCAIITYKPGLYELPYELPGYLRLNIVENSEISGNCPNVIE